MLLDSICIPQKRWGDANKQCWALPQICPQICPQIRKLRTQRFNFRICEPISCRKHLQICGKKIEIYRKSANQQHRWVVSLQFTKKMRFYGSMYGQSWEDVFIKYNTPLPSSAALEQLFAMGAAILTAKLASLTSRNFQMACFPEGKLSFFKVARGCTRRL